MPQLEQESRSAPCVEEKILERLLDQVENPGQYIGKELFQARKDPAGVKARICLAFPDSYEIGMSHLGLRILYAVLNRDDTLQAERAYCPFPDMEARLRNAGVPLYSMETRTPLNAFDVVGFSLQSEMTVTNVLTMLDLGGIPLRRQDRTDADPVIMAGGCVVFNPEPTTDFFDAYLVGDGEEALPRFMRMHRELKEAGVDRTERLARLARAVEGVYVPALYETEQNEVTGFINVVPQGDAPFPVKKALVKDLGPYPYPADMLVPQSDIIHGRVAVEIARGCTEGCRFCQAGIIYRPIRERTPRSIVDAMVKGIDRTGFDEGSLTALSTADFSCITPLARAVMAEFEARHAALSVSSLRVYGITEALALEISRVRKTGFTIAPEAGTQRLRDVINKGITDEDIRAAAGTAFSNGWSRIKLYFMIGLPTETDEDVEGIAHTAVKVWEIGRRVGPRKVKVVVSASSFVPKASASFQWMRFDGVENLRRKQALLKKLLGRYRGIELKFHDPHLSRLEALLARGDRRLGSVIETAWKGGARFDEWSDHFKANLWDNALAKCGVDESPFLDAMPSEEALPWSHVHSRVETAYLLKDMEWGLGARVRPPCSKESDSGGQLVCYGCGVDCDLEAMAEARDRSREEASALVEEKVSGLERVDPTALQFEPTSGPFYRYRVCYAKWGLSRYLSHLEVTRVIARAGNRIHWPVAYTGGFHPHPKLSFGPALSVGVQGEREYFDVDLTEDLEPAALQERLNAVLHEGFHVHAVRRISLEARAVEAEVEEQRFRVQIPEEALDGFRAHLEEKMNSGPWIISRARKGKIRSFDVKPMFVESEIAREWMVTLQAADGRWVKPRELVESLFGGWPDGTVITRVTMGRRVDGRFVTPMDVEDGV